MSRLNSWCMMTDRGKDCRSRVNMQGNHQAFHFCSENCMCRLDTGCKLTGQWKDCRYRDYMEYIALKKYMLSAETLLYSNCNRE